MEYWKSILYILFIHHFNRNQLFSSPICTVRTSRCAWDHVTTSYFAGPRTGPQPGLWTGPWTTGLCPASWIVPEGISKPVRTCGRGMAANSSNYIIKVLKPLPSIKKGFLNWSYVNFMWVCNAYDTSRFQFSCLCVMWVGELYCHDVSRSAVLVHSMTCGNGIWDTGCTRYLYVTIKKAVNLILNLKIRISRYNWHFHTFYKAVSKS